MPITPPRTRAEREYQTQVEDDALVRGLQAQARVTSLSRVHTPEQASTIKKRAIDLSVPFEYASLMGDSAVEEIRARAVADSVKAAPTLAKPLSDPYLSTIADGDEKEMVRTARAAQSRPDKRSYPVIDGFKALFGMDGGDSVRVRTPAEQAAFEAEQAKLGKTFVQGAREMGVGITSNIADLYAKAFEAIGIDPTAAQSIGMLTRLRATEEIKKGDALMPADGGPIKKGVFSAARSLPTSLGGLGVAAVAGPLAGATFIGGTTQGRSYTEGRNQGLDVGEATRYAATDAAIEVATEYVPFARLLNDTPVGSSLGKRLLRNLVDEQIGEQVATALQDLNAWATLPENADKTFNDYLADRPDAAIQTAIATLVSTGATNTVVAAIDKVAKKVAKARTGEEDAVTLDTIMDSAVKHKMRERDPEAFAEYVDSQTQGTGAENVYLPVEALDTLFQSENVDEDVQAFFEQYQDQIEEARVTGGDVVIPTSAIAARLAGTPAWEALKPDARLDAGGFSPRELETEVKEAEKILEQRGEEIANAALDEITANAPAVAVFEDVKAQLVAAGFTEATATKQASVYAANREAWGKRLGMTALEYHQQNPVSFERAGITPDAPDAARVMDQSGFARRNPPATAMVNLVDRSKEGRLRGLMDPSNGDVFWWDAYDKTHNEAAKELGLDEWADGRDHRLYATRTEDGAIEISMGNDFIAPRLRRLAERDPNGDTFRFGAFLGNWESADFLDQLNEYEGGSPDVALNQASRYDERFGGNPVTVADRFGNPASLMEHDDWAMLTAENPRGEQADDITNARAMRDLEADLQAMGLVYTRAIGKYGQVENSFAVVGITQQEAEMLGRKYDQDSVLTRAGLTYQDGSVNPATGEVEVFTERPEDFFTEIPELGVNFAVGIDFDNKINPDTGIAGWTPQRVDKLIESADQSDEKRYVVMMTPDEFLGLTLSEKGREVVSEIVDGFGPLDPAQLEAGGPQTLVLNIGGEPSDYQKKTSGMTRLPSYTMGHDGRHRATLLKKAGVTKMPVVLNIRQGELPQGEPVLIGGNRTREALSQGDTPYTLVAPVQITAANRDAINAMWTPATILFQSATIRRGKETLEKYGLDPSKRHSTRAVAAALEARQRAKYGYIDKTDRSPAAVKKIANWMAEEVEFEMENPGASGVGWYSTKFQNALDIFAGRFPELATDQTARNTMTALIAITSDGQKVLPNFRQAADIYSRFRETGKFTAGRGTQRQDSVDGNMAKMQQLYDTMGADAAAAYLLQEEPVSKLKKIAAEQGIQFSSAYPASTKLPLAAVVFGPKLGAFYANLMGADGYLTMDRWWSRTFNRYRGSLLQAPTRQGLDRFKQLLGDPTLSDDEALAATVEPRKAYEKRGFKNGSELEKAANTLYKAAFENIEDQPFNGSDRAFMLETVAAAKKLLKRRGTDISVADIQAVLWYYEKRLYGELGARQTADISYEEAARDVVAGGTGGRTASSAVVDPGTETFGAAPQEGVVYYQSENPIFYSALARAIDSSKQTKAPASQWKGVLQNAPGVKAEELEWSGLLEMLDFDPNAVLTKEQLADAVAAGGIKIEEVVLGDRADVTRRARELFEEDNALRIAEGISPLEDNGDYGGYMFTARNEFAGQDAQFQSWSSDPSNDTYRELLLTLPIGQGGNPERAPSTHWDQPAVVAHVRFMDKEDVDGNRVLFVEEVQSDWHQKGRDQGYESQPDPQSIEMAKVKLQEAMKAEDAAREAFWPLAQRAWDEGYAAAAAVGQEVADAWEMSFPRITENSSTGTMLSPKTRGGIAGFDEAKEALQQAANAARLADRELRVAQGVGNTGVPNAPFKTSWPALVMKRVIKYAVDGGYDKVAWTTGEQQADRYSLAESTGPLTVRAGNGSGNYYVGMNARAAEMLVQNNLGGYSGSLGTLIMTPEQMKEAFGNDIAKRAIDGAEQVAESQNDAIAAAEARFKEADRVYTDILAVQLEADQPDTAAVNAAGNEQRRAARALEDAQSGGFTLEGEDLKIGGEGMKAFYDRNLVNITNGLVKKAGAKVGPVRIRGENAPAGVQTQTGLIASVEQREANKKQAQELIAALGETESPRYRSLVAALGELEALTDDAIAEAVKGGDAQPGFEITDALREQASAGFPLFQKTGKPRGQIAMYTDRMVITLFEDADLSTLLHETGHLFVEELARNAQRPNAPADVKADWAAMRKWLKQNGHTVKGANIPREAHELMARGFERYLMEGRAPSKNLEGVFGTFRAWLVRIYQNVQRLASPITPEVREVFDRLLATQEAIDAYREEQNARPLFADKPADMTQAEFDAYRESVLASRDEAQARLTKKIMEDIRKRENKRYRDRAKDVRDDVIEELNTDPRFVALHLLRTGRWLGDGTREPFPVKIDRDWFVSTYGATALDRLPKGPFLVKKDGDEADFIAEMVGFPSGAAMIDALFEMGDAQVAMRAEGDRRSLIDKETDERVKAILEADGTADTLTAGTIEEEAQAAVENEQQGALLSTELRYLSRGTNQTPTPYRMARVWAERKIRAGTVQAVASRAAVQQYARAASKSGRLAEEALIAGDQQEAYRQKQAQLINHALFMEAKLAADKVDTIVARMRRLGKRAAMKSVDQDYMDRVHGLLEGFDFRKKSRKFLEEQQGFAEWAAGQAALGFEVQVPPRLMLNGTPYARASVEELYGLDDAVKALLHLGKLKQGIKDGQAEREFNSLIDEMVAKINELPDRKLSTEINEEDRPAASVLSFLIKIETIADDLDGGDPNGPFNRLLTQRANDMENVRSALRDRALNPISQAYLNMPSAQRKRLEEKVTIPQFRHKGGELDPRNGQPTTMTRMELLSVALNTGNLSNLEKMATGEGWSIPDIRAVLNKELTKEDWDFVQSIWDSLASLWPDIAATERALSGVVPEQVEITPVQTPFGEYRGGYYPVVYDPARSQRAENNALNEANDLFGMKSGINTPKGHTITRTEATGPILRSVEAVLFTHIEKVITRIAYAEYARDVLRTMDNPRVRNAIDLKLGREYRKQIRPWLQRVVNAASVDQRGLNWAERFLRSARVNMSLVAMGFRVSTAIAQIGGLNQSAGRIGPRYVALGMKTLLRDRGKAVQFVFDRSPEMERRNGEVNRDVADAMKMMRGKNGIVNKARVMAFWHIGMMDRYAVAVPTWLGAHAKAIDEGMTDKEASYYADKMVRTSQGSGAEKDLANWQSPNSEAMRALTLFYTIFNVQLNAQWESVRAVKKGNYMKAAVLTGWFLMMAPLVDALLSNDIPDPDDDDDTWANWFFRNVFFNLFSGIPLVRDVSGYAERKMAGQYATAGTSPVLRAEDAAIKAGGLAVKAAQGEELPDNTVKTMIETPGYFLGLPTGQAAATGQFLWDYTNGDTNPEGFTDWYFGLVKGKVPEEK